MWSFVKGLFLGLVLLWLVLVLSLSARDGLVTGGIFGFIMVKSALSEVQRSTGGLGLYLVLALILSLWIRSRFKKQPNDKLLLTFPAVKSQSNPTPDHSIVNSGESTLP